MDYSKCKCSYTYILYIHISCFDNYVVYVEET